MYYNRPRRGGFSQARPNARIRRANTELSPPYPLGWLSTLPHTSYLIPGLPIFPFNPSLHANPARLREVLRNGSGIRAVAEPEQYVQYNPSVPEMYTISDASELAHSVRFQNYAPEPLNLYQESAPMELPPFTGLSNLPLSHGIPRTGFYTWNPYERTNVRPPSSSYWPTPHLGFQVQAQQQYRGWQEGQQQQQSQWGWPSQQQQQQQQQSQWGWPQPYPVRGYEQAYQQLASLAQPPIGYDYGVSRQTSTYGTPPYSTAPQEYRDPRSQPAPQPAPRPAPQPAPQPALQLAPPPAPRLAPQPAPQLPPQPASQLAPQPAHQPALRLAPEFVPQLSLQPDPQPDPELAPQPARQPAPRLAPEFVPQSAPQRDPERPAPEITAPERPTPEETEFTQDDSFDEFDPSPHLQAVRLRISKYYPNTSPAVPQSPAVPAQSPNRNLEEAHRRESDRPEPEISSTMHEHSLPWNSKVRALYSRNPSTNATDIKELKVFLELTPEWVRSFRLTSPRFSHKTPLSLTTERQPVERNQQVENKTLRAETSYRLTPGVRPTTKLGTPSTLRTGERSRRSTPQIVPLNQTSRSAALQMERQKRPPGSWPWPISDPGLWASTVGLEEFEVPDALCQQLQCVKPSGPGTYEFAEGQIERILEHAFAAASRSAGNWVRTHLGLREDMQLDCPRLVSGYLSEDGKVIPSERTSEETDTFRYFLRRRDGEVLCTLSFIGGTDCIEAMHQCFMAVGAIYKRQCQAESIKAVYGILTDSRLFWFLRKTPGFETMLTPNSYGPYYWNDPNDQTLIFSFFCMMIRECIHQSRQENPTYLPVSHTAPLGRNNTPKALKAQLGEPATPSDPNMGMAPLPPPPTTQGAAAFKSEQLTVSSAHTATEQVFTGSAHQSLGVIREDTPSVFALDSAKPKE